MMRDEVRAFVVLGPLPDERAPATVIQQHESALSRIKRPVSDDEAQLLMTAFGPDDCYGLAWALLYLIETAPHLSVRTEPGPVANEWVQRLWERSQRLKNRGPSGGNLEI